MIPLDAAGGKANTDLNRRLFRHHSISSDDQMWVRGKALPLSRQTDSPAFAEGHLIVRGNQLGIADSSALPRGEVGKISASAQDRISNKARTASFLQLYDKVKAGFGAVGDYSRLHDRFTFEDRRANADVLVCMLAGYKADLWNLVMPRFSAALPEADVCIVSPGKRSEALAELCRREGWSYLNTATNDVALAQNICYRLHSAAEMIVKLDEDMFLLPMTISALLAEYRTIKAEGIVDPGFVAPMIPLNGFCYRHLFEMLGILEEYEAIFGRARLAVSGLAIHKDAAAARWAWEHTSPLATTAAKLAELGPRRLLCPIQFSIGLIAFERSFWELIGYFAVYRRRLLAGLSTLGADEAYICARALTMSRPAVVTTSAVAGHFSFGPQYAALKTLLDERAELFVG